MIDYTKYTVNNIEPSKIQKKIINFCLKKGDLDFIVSSYSSPKSELFSGLTGGWWVEDGCGEYIFGLNYKELLENLEEHYEQFESMEINIINT